MATFLNLLSLPRWKNFVQLFVPKRIRWNLWWPKFKREGWCCCETDSSWQILAVESLSHTHMFLDLVAVSPVCVRKRRKQPCSNFWQAFEKVVETNLIKLVDSSLLLLALSMQAWAGASFGRVSAGQSVIMSRTCTITNWVGSVLAAYMRWSLSFSHWWVHMFRKRMGSCEFFKGIVHQLNQYQFRS